MTWAEHKTHYGVGLNRSVDHVRTLPLFCKPCLAKGHQCPAQEGTDECIFCEDGVPCPVLQRKLVTTSASPVLPEDALLQPEQVAKKRGPPVVTVHAKDVPKFMNNGGRALAHAAVKAVTMENEDRVRICSVEGCGKKLRAASNRSGRCAKHFYLRRRNQM